MHISIIALLVGVAAITATPSAPTVQQFGAMKAVMRDGQTEARVALKDVVALPHAYAIGALEGLNGEIAIIDGAVWVARVGEEGLHVTGPEVVDTDQATMLTVAHVEHWTEHKTGAVLAGSALEAWIERTAAAQGIDTAKPFPFLIEGEVVGLDVHVMKGYCPVATDASTQDNQPWHWSLADGATVQAMIVGFFAKDAAGVMTHHGTSIHAHVLWSQDSTARTAHLEAATISVGATLSLPGSTEQR